MFNCSYLFLRTLVKMKFDKIIVILIFAEIQEP